MFEPIASYPAADEGLPINSFGDVDHGNPGSFQEHMAELVRGGIEWRDM